MPVKCQTILKWLEEWAPRFLAEKGDQVGLLVGNPYTEIKKVLVTLEVTEEVITEAIREKVQLIISHHPPFHTPLPHLRFDLYPGSLLSRLIQNDIHLFVAHTNLDTVTDGVSDILVRRLGLLDVEILYQTYEEKLYKVVVFVPQGYEDAVRQAMCAVGAGWIGKYAECTFQTEGMGTFRALPGADPFLGKIGELEKVCEYRLETVVPEAKLEQVLGEMIKSHPYEEVAYDVYLLQNKGRCYGLGRIGKLAETRPLGVFAEGVKELLGVKGIRLVGNLEKKVSKVALCGGSAMMLLPKAVDANADVYLTGDVKHHEALEALERGIAVIDAGHHGTERVIVPVLAEYLWKKAEKEQQGLEVLVSQVNTDPFLYF